MKVIPIEVLENFLNNYEKYYIKGLKQGHKYVFSRDNMKYFIDKLIKEYSFEIN